MPARSLGFLAAIGFGAAAGHVLFGVAGVLIGLAIGLALYIRRRRRSSKCAPVPEVVQVEPPRMQTGDWLGLPASGRSMRVDEVSFIRITGGRISGTWGLEDTWTRMRQLAGDDAALGELGSLS